MLDTVVAQPPVGPAELLPYLDSCTSAGQQAGREGGTEAASSDPRRPYAAPPSEVEPENESAPDLSGRGHFENLEHETRFELASAS